MKVPGTIDFSNRLREWDGFGVNYVETCQTYDYSKYPQDYGGFSTLSDDKKQEIIGLIFGNEGLRPSLIKMFLDPLHQLSKPTSLADTIESSLVQRDLYDHETMTENMRYFVSEGLKRTRERNQDLSIYSTLYGPPLWMTKQKVWRGRDLDEACSIEICRYIVSWVQYLKTQGFPIAYIGVHNEGEDFYRWDDDGLTRITETGHDYNLYWSPEQINSLLPVLQAVLEKNRMTDVKPTPGETSNWSRFHDWGYSQALCSDSSALESIGLITSHGFFKGVLGAAFYGDHRSSGIDMIREKRPELHAWTTSTSWSEMDSRFLLELKNQIYSAKVNGIIPWACIQNHSLWAEGDPNPGCAITVDGKGGYQIVKGYWYYKQVCQIGQGGMDVVQADIANSAMGLIAFADSKKQSFCLINAGNIPEEVILRLRGLRKQTPDFATRTSKSENSIQIKDLQIRYVDDEVTELHYTAPSDSATTFVF